MDKVILGMVLSLDGFVNDRNGSAEALYSDFEGMMNSELLQEAMRNTGAVIMGRRNYDMGQGDFTGYEFQVPLFVVTHQPPEQVAKGQNDKLSFTFVTDGVESAIAKAKAAAGDKDVTIVGGPSIAQQALKAGLVDELQLDFAAVILGQGLRFFEHLEDANIQLERIKVSEEPTYTHLRFRVVK